MHELSVFAQVEDAEGRDVERVIEFEAYVGGTVYRSVLSPAEHVADALLCWRAASASFERPW